MLLLTSTSDIVRVTTGSAADVRAHASWVDNASGAITPGRTNTASIASATTTTIVASPGSSTQRNVKNLSVRNVHASTSTTVLIEHYDGVTAECLWNGTLLAGEGVTFDQDGLWTLYDVTGAVKPSSAYTNPTNWSTASQSPTAAADTTLTGSTITIPASKIKIGTRFRFLFSVAKTAAGTAASTFTFRLGTNGGTTSDTAVCAFSTGTATAAADVGLFELNVVCRGPLTSSAVFQGHLSLTHNLATTGWSTTGVGVQTTSSAFDITQSGLTASVSFNGGASLVSTFQLVSVETYNL